MVIKYLNTPKFMTELKLTDDKCDVQRYYCSYEVGLTDGLQLWTGIFVSWNKSTQSVSFQNPRRVYLVFSNDRTTEEYTREGVAAIRRKGFDIEYRSFDESIFDTLENLCVPDFRKRHNLGN